MGQQYGSTTPSTEPDLQRKNAIMAGRRPARRYTAMNNIFVLARPGRAWLRAKTSWYYSCFSDVCSRRSPRYSTLVQPRGIAALFLYKLAVNDCVMYRRPSKRCGSKVPCSYLERYRADEIREYFYWLCRNCPGLVDIAALDRTG